jgi:hypothetical protein
VEAVAMPGAQQEIKGLAAVKGKNEWWLANHEIHSASVSGPWPHGDRFVVGFHYDVTNKPSGKRMKMDEVGLYTVRNGKSYVRNFSTTPRCSILARQQNGFVQEIVRGGAIVGHGAAATKQPFRN